MALPVAASELAEPPRLAEFSELLSLKMMAPVTLALPATWSFSVGAAVPMPTSPSMMAPFVGAVDVLRLETAADEPPRWEIHINGGRKATGLDALEWVDELVDRGAGELVLNSIDADGTRDGYDLELNRAVARRVDVPIVASGGAGTTQHIFEVLTEGEANAALAASIFHFQVYSIPQVKDFLADRGVVVRPYAA